MGNASRRFTTVSTPLAPEVKCACPAGGLVGPRSSRLQSAVTYRPDTPASNAAGMKGWPTPISFYRRKRFARGAFPLGFRAELIEYRRRVFTTKILVQRNEMSKLLWPQ